MEKSDSVFSNSGKVKPKYSCEFCYRRHLKCLFWENDETACVECKKRVQECIKRSGPTRRRDQVLNLNEPIAVRDHVFYFTKLLETFDIWNSVKLIRSLMSLCRIVGYNNEHKNLELLANLLCLKAFHYNEIRFLHVATTIAITNGSDIGALHFAHIGRRNYFETVGYISQRLTYLTLQNAGSMYDIINSQHPICFLKIEHGSPVIAYNNIFYNMFYTNDINEKLKAHAGIGFGHQFVREGNQKDGFLLKAYYAFLNATKKVDVYSTQMILNYMDWDFNVPNVVVLDVLDRAYSCDIYQRAIATVDAQYFYMFLAFVKIQTKPEQTPPKLKRTSSKQSTKRKRGKN